MDLLRAGPFYFLTRILQFAGYLKIFSDRLQLDLSAVLREIAMIFALLSCTAFWIAVAAALHDNPASFYLAVCAGMLCALPMLAEARVLLGRTSDDPKKR